MAKETGSGHIQGGLETDALKVKPKLQDIRPDGGGHKGSGLWDLGSEMGWREVINIGLNKEKAFSNTRVEAPSSSKNGEGSARKMEAVYQQRVKQIVNVLCSEEKQGGFECWVEQVYLEGGYSG